MLKKFRSIDDDDDMADYHEYGSEARTQESEHGLRHCPHARKGNPTFRLTYFQNDGIMYYILFSTAPRPQFSYFRTPKS